MNKTELVSAAIEVFSNGNGLLNQVHYSVITPGVLPEGWTYPDLQPFTNPDVKAWDHPFPYFTGGWEEIGNNRGNITHCGNPYFSFNQKLIDVMIASHAPRTFIHDNVINTLDHYDYERGHARLLNNTEIPDLCEVSENIAGLPSYHGNTIYDACECGHVNICQSRTGQYNKICHELWKLQRSGVQRSFFIALFTHKVDLTADEGHSYRNHHNNADLRFVTHLNQYRSDIQKIDSEYVHLIFKGIRPSSSRETFFHAIIIELHEGFDFTVIQNNGGLYRIRPAE